MQKLLTYFFIDYFFDTINALSLCFKMDTSQLKKVYPSGIPQKVQQYIDTLSKLNLKMVLMPNFGKDVEQSLKHGVDIYKGMQVIVPSDYVLSEKDKAWFHPDLYRTRAMYKHTSVDQKANISDFSSLVGTYYKHTVDELGSMRKERVKVVDNGIEIKDWSNWFDSSIKQVYSKMQLSKINNKSFMATTLGRANELAASKAIRTYNYNMLYKGASEYHFYNHVMKPTDGKVLIHVSPLIGFAEITTSKAIQSDLLSEQDYLDVNNLKEEQRTRAFVDCYWKGKSVVNTFCMRKPIPNYNSFIHNADIYRMEKGVFSPNPIVDKLPVDIILFLTPQSKNIPESRKRQFHNDVQNDLIRVKASPEMLAKMIHQYKDLFRSELIDGDHLVLDREIVSQWN